MSSRARLASTPRTSPLARIMRLVGALAHGVADLAGQHAVMALALEQPAQHLFGTTVVIDVGGVDEIHTLFARRSDDARGLVVRRLFAEHHGAQAQRRYAEVAVSQSAVIHGGSLVAGGVCAGSYCQKPAPWDAPAPRPCRAMPAFRDPSVLAERQAGMRRRAARRRAPSSSRSEMNPDSVEDSCPGAWRTKRLDDAHQHARTVRPKPRRGTGRPAAPGRTLAAIMRASSS